jgi:hypothetical protein
MDRDAWKLYANPHANEQTQLIPIPQELPEQTKPTWTLENSKLRVDVTLKQ